MTNGGTTMATSPRCGNTSTTGTYNFNEQLSGLSTGTYNYIACAENSRGEDCGDVESFTITRDTYVPPVVTNQMTVYTDSYSWINQNNGSVTLNGHYNNNTNGSTTTSFEYRRNGESTRSVIASTSSDNSRSFNVSLYSLYVGTYEYRACATGSTNGCGDWNTFYVNQNVIIDNNNNNQSTIQTLPVLYRGQDSALALLISGGHTEIVLSERPMHYTKLGETLDDAVGECYDKVARMLGLPYPGGPEISRLAQTGRGGGVALGHAFPRPMQHSNDLNFSFSGLKTAVLYYVKNKELTPDFKIAVATEFEQAVCDVLMHKLQKAVAETGAQTIIIGGGVAANTYLKTNFQTLADKNGLTLHISSKDLSTDNALMIGLCAMYHIDQGVLPSETINVLADSSLSF
jgi:hypothetical protein